MLYKLLFKDVSLLDKKRACLFKQALLKKPSDYLLSRTVARVVPSALRSLTTVFGMGTGVASSVWSLRKIKTTV